MKKKVKFMLDKEAFISFLKTDEVKNALLDAGEEVARIAGAGVPDEEYGVNVHNASFTAIANVFPNSKAAANSNYEHNTIIKATEFAGLSFKKRKKMK